MERKKTTRKFSRENSNKYSEKVKRSERDYSDRPADSKKQKSDLEKDMDAYPGSGRGPGRGRSRPDRRERSFTPDRKGRSRRDQPERSFTPDRKEGRGREREEFKPAGFRKKNTGTDYHKRGASFTKKGTWGKNDRNPEAKKDWNPEGKKDWNPEEKKDWNPERKKDRRPEGKKVWNPEGKKDWKSDGKNEPRNYEPVKKSYQGKKKEDDGLIRLNRYIANSGICSRREADDYITAGLISVNGKTVTQLGTKVSPDDIVKYNGEAIRKEKPVYVLLNKPRDYITTTDDPFERNTVMALIKNACKERIYPVGRLDRNTTGLLLFTNDGDLAKKLTHPSHGVKKIYQAELDKNLRHEDLRKISDGVVLEDGIARVDEISYDADGKNKKIVGIELHQGRNRIVRRIFEQLGYEVKKLDRVYFAGLTKKDLPRGRWRFLTSMELNMLRMQV